MDNTYVKLFRSFDKWEWWDDHNVTRVFLYLMMNVNHSPNKWCGELVQAGEIITSFGNLSIGVGLSVQQVRTAILKLEKSDHVKVSTTNKYTSIKLIDWRKFQSGDGVNNKQITSKQQTGNKQITTIKECKERKECKEIYNTNYSDFKKSGNEDLEKIRESWNNFILKRKVKNNTISIGENIFTTCRRITPDLEKEYKRLIKTYSLVDFTEAFEAYAKDRTERDGESDFATHKFSLYEFLKQKNGFTKYINR